MRARSAGRAHRAAELHLTARQRRGSLSGMRVILILLALGSAVGCQAPERVRQSLAHEIKDLQQLEAALLPLIPDSSPIDFGGGVAYRSPDGWRVTLRAMQLRAAGLLAWAQNETFDHEAGYQALVAPALAEARRRAKETP